MTPKRGGLVLGGGLAAAGGGALFVAHGVVMMLVDANLDAPPYALPLIALGLVGLCTSLEGQRSLLRKGGCVLAYAALAVALVQFVALVLMRWREEPFWSVHSGGLALSLLLVLIATLLLSVAALRAATWRSGWRIVPSVVGLLWLPLWVSGEWVGDRLSPMREISLGFVPTGVMWILLGAALVLGTTAPTPTATPGPWWRRWWRALSAGS